jgi:hypothetical protein
MAGYKRSKRFILEFEDEEFDGLEVTVGQPSIQDILTIRRVQGLLGEKDADQEDAFEKLCKILGKYIKEWNLEDDDDQPIKPSSNALLDQDVDFVLAIVVAWTRASVGVADPLDEGSPSGETSLEASLATESVSLSQSS